MCIEQSAKRTLFVVAHPDDETIFMGGLIRRLAAKGHALDIACATSRFASQLISNVRRAEFLKACHHLEARGILMEFEDGRAPLPELPLAERVRSIAEATDYDTVYTHGVWGEYGHRHHRDVCLAVHRIFGDRTRCLAGPLDPDIKITLSPEEMEMKRRLAWTTYGSQMGIANWCSGSEHFTRIPISVTELLIGIANGEPSIDGVAVQPNETLCDAIQRSRNSFDGGAVPFPEVSNIPERFWKPAHRQFSLSLAAFEVFEISQ
jgi:LmbE family N-acetylglucosaminyl deacetylase